MPRNIEGLRKILPRNDDLYHVPVLDINVQYLDPYELDSRRNGRIQVKYSDKVGTVEEIARVFFEEQGLTVLNGYDVDTFLRLFLLQVPLPFVTEMKDFQTKQRALMKQYFANEVAFEHVVRNAVKDATTFYLPPKKKWTRKITRLRGDIAWSLPTYTTSNPDNYTEIQKLEKKECFDHLANDFLPQCVHKSDLKKFERAYLSMIKGNPPDLFVYNSKKKLWLFVEVKSFNDSLQPNQWDWIKNIQQHLNGHVMVARVIPSGRDLRGRLTGY